MQSDQEEINQLEVSLEATKTSNKKNFPFLYNDLLSLLLGLGEVSLMLSDLLVLSNSVSLSLKWLWNQSLIIIRWIWQTLLKLAEEYLITLIGFYVLLSFAAGHLIGTGVWCKPVLLPNISHLKECLRVLTN